MTGQGDRGQGDRGQGDRGQGAPGPPRRRRRWRAGGVDRGPRQLSESLDDVLGALLPPSTHSAPTHAPPAQSASTHSAPTHSSPPAPAAPSRPAPSASVWGTVFSRWEDIVGPSIAKHTRPLRLDGGRLVVAVDQPPWATQVRALSPGILERLSAETGEALEGLDVVIRR